MKTLILSLILSLSLTSCEWIKSLGPEEPFFCKINGEKFRPEKDDRPIGGGGVAPLSASINKVDNWLVIRARNDKKLLTLRVKLEQDNKVETGTYSLNEIRTTSNAIYYVDYSAEPANLEELISTEGTLTILRNEGFKITGTFNFRTINSKKGVSFSITEGEFNNLSYF